jgi:serine-type D-Ala-D-Ala carboxypeptidase (penicillin-binding protein 5/6)
MPFASRLAALAVVGAVVAAGLSACANGANARPVSAALHARSAGADPSASARASATPSQPDWEAIQVASAPQQVRALGGALADAGTDELLWSRGLNTERPMGSVTKVMTALVVLQSGDLNRQIRIPAAVLAYVAKYQAESAGLHPGDVLTTGDLLEALLLESACDAAYVLATTYGPGMPAFLAKMNAMAVKLGMTHTHFTSPDGLPYPTEYSTYSTPADLMTLGLAAMKVPVFRSIVDQRFYNLPGSRGVHHRYWFGNTNDLIGSYQGAIGIKTGYTDAAKHCLLFEAVRNGTTLIGVVLGSPDSGPAAGSDAAERLLNWGFGLKLAASGAQSPPSAQNAQ